MSHRNFRGKRGISLKNSKPTVVYKLNTYC